MVVDVGHVLPEIRLFEVFNEGVQCVRVALQTELDGGSLRIEQETDSTVLVAGFRVSGVRAEVGGAVVV